ncbi:MAG: DUF308 domain-containing protein [Verrucomicrobiota bacterium]|nr:DUF308 domain-containing protein [Verrucomicrobiota bacterium]
MQEKSGDNQFRWGYLVLGMLFILASMLAFSFPILELGAMAYAFAFMAILRGIWLLTNRFGSALRVLVGILDILIGIFIIFNIYAMVMVLPYIFAIWFVLDSIFRLLSLGVIRPLGKGYVWFAMIVNLLGVIIGVMLLFHPVFAAWTLSMLVGFYFLLAGVDLVMVAFPANRRP